MRVGIMGGTLDPVHKGHLQIANAAREILSLDRIMLLPAGDPPHKAQPISKLDRLEMVRLAANEIQGAFPCSIEIFREGTTYTVDTLRELHEMNPGVEWYYIIGADTLDVLDTWRNFSEVAKLCVFAVTGRAENDANLDRVKYFEEKYGAEFVVLGINGPDISSSEVRAMVLRGEDASEYLPTSVYKYIKDHGLYLCWYSREKLVGILQEKLKPSRLKHTLGVAETAKRLANQYGIDPARAELAALLHDCAKYMTVKEMKKLVREHIQDADSDELNTESVLHAPAGAVLAEIEYGVKDPQIISAIRKHTLGDTEMSPMDMLIYTADFIEPGRREFPGLAEARELASSDLSKATVKCAQLTNEYLLNQGLKPHRRSLEMMNKQTEI